MDVGIRRLRAHLSQYVARVRSGETVIVTDRGQPVAKLVPPDVREPPEAIRHLVEAGKILCKPPPRQLPKPIELLPGEKTSLDYLREQRR